LLEQNFDNIKWDWLSGNPNDNLWYHPNQYILK